MASNNQEYLGRGWAYPPSFNRSVNGPGMVAGEQDIRESLEILMATHLGERVMRADYGAGLEDLLFEPISTTLITLLRDRVASAIRQYEPRILVDRIEVFQRDPAKGLVELVMDYRIAANNTRNNFVYPFYLLEGTHLAQ